MSDTSRTSAAPCLRAAPGLRAARTVLALAAAAAAGSAHAQSSTSGSAFNAGYGGGLSQTANSVNVSRAYDANGNHVVVDGVTQTGSDQSVFYSRQTSGAGDTYAGAGGLGGGTAIGNNLQVSVVGSNNTVVVNSTQTNNAPVTATTVLNGQVNLDGNGN